MRSYRLAVLPILAAIVLLAGCDDQLLPAADSANDWMPLTQGNFWTYRITTDPSGPNEKIVKTTMRLDRDTLIGGIMWYGPLNASPQYMWRPDGLYSVDRFSDLSRRAHRMIRLPVRLGDTIDTYTVGDALHGTDIVRTLDGVDVPVTVPMGTLRCIRVAATSVMRAGRWPEVTFHSVTYEYYALHIGRVKTEIWNWSGDEPRHLDYVAELTNVHIRIVM
jgi:hypothetical protein